MKLIALLIAICMISSSIYSYIEASPIEEKISHYLPSSFLSLFYLIFPKLFDAIKNESNNLIQNQQKDSIQEEIIDQEENKEIETLENYSEEGNNKIIQENKIEDINQEKNISNELIEENNEINENETEETQEGINGANENVENQENESNEAEKDDIQEYINQEENNESENVETLIQDNEISDGEENNDTNENIENHEVEETQENESNEAEKDDIQEYINQEENNESENVETLIQDNEISDGEENNDTNENIVSEDESENLIEDNESISENHEVEETQQNDSIEGDINNESDANQSENLLNWAYLVYISGDNDLYTYAINELNELLGINSNGIAILFDGSLNNDSALYIISNNSITVIEKNELNMGNASTLEEFISFAQENLKAKNYVIEFWGHGNGWAGVCFDKGSSDTLDLMEIKGALENRNISIIVFSACHMGCIEVAYALRNCSQYMLASPCAMLATGLPHEAIFRRVSNVSAEEFCWIIYEEYMNYYSYASPKFGIWNLSIFDEFIGQFSLFIDFVKNYSWRDARNESAINLQYIDLYSFLNKINFNLPSIVYGNGSIYFPLPLYYSKYYGNTDFAKSTQWDEFLKSIK
ncbi:MAG: clostripain-related cysteine peptidase [Candidatus Thermoplasmatota archaeon]